MTRCNNNEKVEFTFGSWVKFVITVVGAMALQWFALQGRVATIEANQINIRRDIDNNQARAEQTRKEFLEEVKSLRQVLTK